MQSINKSDEIQTEGHIEEYDDRQYTVKNVPISYTQILYLTCCGFAVSLAWSIQIGYATATLRELGLTNEMVAYVWIAGPISGIVMQIFIGTISDRSTFKFGRRRIWMIIGTIFIVISLLLFSNAGSIGRLLGDTEKTTIIGAAIAVIAFWILDFSINMLQGPARAIIADILPGNQQDLGNAFFSFFNGLGKTFGYFMGSLKLVQIFPFFATEVRALYTINAFIVLFVVIIHCAGTPEKQFKPKGHQPSFMTQLIDGIKTTPKAAWLAFLVQLVSFFAWFGVFMFVTTWVGTSIYDGDPHAPVNTPRRIAFEEGVKVGNFGLVMLSVVSIIYSLMLPSLMRIFTPKIMWCFGQLIMTVGLALTAFVTNKVIVVIIIGMLGIPFATLMTIPWAIVCASVSHKSDRGIYTAIFNMSQCIPDIVVSIAGGLAFRFAEAKISYVLAAGAVPAFIASCLVFITDTSGIEHKAPPKTRPESEELLLANYETEDEL